MKNSIYKIRYLLFLSWDWEAWCLTQFGGNTPPPERNTAWNKGRKCFHCLGAPNNLIRPWRTRTFTLHGTDWTWNIFPPKQGTLVYPSRIISYPPCSGEGKSCSSWEPNSRRRPATSYLIGWTKKYWKNFWTLREESNCSFMVNVVRQNNKGNYYFPGFKTNSFTMKLLYWDIS